MISAETKSRGILSLLPRWVNRDMNSWQTKLGSFCENCHAASLALSINDCGGAGSEAIVDGSIPLGTCDVVVPRFSTGCGGSTGCRITEQPAGVHDSWAWRTSLIDETSGNRTKNSFSRILSAAERRSPSPSRNSAREGLLELSKTRANCADPGFPVAGILTERISPSSADAWTISWTAA